MEQIPDSELILSTRGHDDEAFAELVRRYTPMMDHAILSFGSDAFIYNEAFCEALAAFLRATLGFDLTQDKVTFGLYAKVCVTNCLRDLLRQRNAMPVSIDADTVAVADGIEHRLVGRETFDLILSRARALLSDYEYRVLLLHVQGYSTATIAADLGRSAKSVDNAKTRIFHRLRSEFSDEGRL